MYAHVHVLDRNGINKGLQCYATDRHDMRTEQRCLSKCHFEMS